MRGGSYEDLIYFLRTRELPKLITYFSNCDQRDKDKAVELVELYKQYKLDPDTLVKKLNSLMPISVSVFGTPATPATPATPSKHFNLFYDDALYLANYNKTKYPDTWKAILHTTFETPEDYALDAATRSEITYMAPPPAYKPFVQPAPGTYGGV